MPPNSLPARANGKKPHGRRKATKLRQLLLVRRHTPRRMRHLHRLLQRLKGRRNRTTLWNQRRHALCKRGKGNGIFMSVQCLNKGSMMVNAPCKSNALKCGHVHIMVNLDKIGSFVTINWFTVHTSAYPDQADAFVAQFFFCTSSSARPKRQITHGAPFLKGNINPALPASVGRRVVTEWQYLLSTRRRKGEYQGRPLNDVVEYSTCIIETDLEHEFRELHELMRAAEHQYSQLHTLAAVTHTIWIIVKKARGGEQEGGRGGFGPHVDQFEGDKNHIGTISMPVAFVRRLGER